MLESSAVLEASTLPAFITPEMEVAILNRENAINFIKTYQDVYGRDMSDA